MRSLLSVLVLLVVTLGASLPAGAADEQLIADALTSDGYYLEGVDPGEVESVRSIVATLGTDGPYLVVLQEEVGDASLFAEGVLELMDPGTVIVLTPQLIGTASDFFADDELDSAIDASLPAFDVDYGEGLAAFDDALESGGAVTTQDEATGSGFPTGLVVILILIAGGVGFVVWRSNREKVQSAEEDLEEAREEVGRQVATVANEILELSDRVGVSAEPDAETLFREANATFSSVEEALPQALTVAAVERLGERLDEARWQLESVEAKLEGRIPPPKPVDRPARCFFDPAHRAGTEEALLKTAAGDQTVSVCRNCQASLARGELVEPRQINVGGRPVPAPRAPKSYGGSGFDWMDVFSVVVGGSNVAYDMRRTRGRRASGRGSVLPRRRSTPARRGATAGRARPRKIGRATRSRSRSPGRSSRRR